ncbi:MAG TPA: hypothetical protein PLK29_07415 [Chiayiivirga sp.]|nr:hypothetical protein [Chiayiivirga sp.]
MSLRLGLVLLLAAPAAYAVAPSCADVDGWNAGRRSQAADAACTAEGYAEGYRLGEALADLETRRKALEGRIAGGAQDAGALRRQQRQIDVDIEAIHGVATLRGWPVQTLSEDAKKETAP